MAGHASRIPSQHILRISISVVPLWCAMTTLWVQALGKSTQIKLGPMAPMSGAVQQALSQLGLKSIQAGDCKLMYKGSPVDLNAPLRFSNLPSGSRLELLTGKEVALGVRDSRELKASPAAAAPSASCSAPSVAVRAPAFQPDDAQPTGPSWQPESTAPDHGNGTSRMQAHAQAETHSAGVEGASNTTTPAVQAEDLEDDPSVALFGRKVHVFHTQDEATSVEAANQDPPDDFYDFNESDYRHVVAGYAAQKAKQAGAVLKTRQLREREEQARFEAQADTPVPIRLVLPDGHCLQAVLKARETTGRLYDLVAAALLPGLSFHLFVTPPKMLLPRQDGTSLWKAELLPAARVHVGVEGGPAPGPLLRPEVVALVQRGAPAPGFAQAGQQGIGRGPQEREAMPQLPAAAHPRRPPTGGAARSGALPKWLKPAGK
uniref:TUG ubiquitin-like domain-containing protein n=1 Tax=Auxenochlorella protothecoides TaxID=3075 RepID=A0A1D1ZU20_AUXPR